jgi:hypothetical protein
MSTTDDILEPDAELDDGYDPDEDLETSGETPTGTSAASFGRNFDDLPEGYVTASSFAKVLEAQRNVKVKPQVIFAMAKSSKTFPAIRHTDMRVIVPVREGLEWWDAKETKVGEGGGKPRSTEPTAFEKAQAAAKAAGTASE